MHIIETKEGIVLHRRKRNRHESLTFGFDVTMLKSAPMDS
jgi:hypothetical protein